MINKFFYSFIHSDSYSISIQPTDLSVDWYNLNFYPFTHSLIHSNITRHIPLVSNSITKSIFSLAVNSIWPIPIRQVSSTFLEWRMRKRTEWWTSVVLMNQRECIGNRWKSIWHPCKEWNSKSWCARLLIHMELQRREKCTSKCWEER